LNPCLFQDVFLRAASDLQGTLVAASLVAVAAGLSAGVGAATCRRFVFAVLRASSL
jgi:hypothetical protein